MGTSCDCTVCSLARLNLGYSDYAQKHTNPQGSGSNFPKSPPAKALRVCKRCFNEVGRGKPHTCVKSKKGDNLANIVRSSSGKSRSKVASSTLKTLADDQGVSLRGGTLQLATGSRPLPVIVGAPKIKPKDPKFSHESLQKLQTANNLSDKTLL